MTHINSSQKRIIDAAIKWFAKHGSSSITVSELANTAGVTRATVYNNHLHPDTLFPDICTRLRQEMAEQVLQALSNIHHPAQRIATGLKLYLERAADEPDWARFLCNFAYHPAMPDELSHGIHALGDELRNGIKSGDFSITEADIPAMLGLIGGTVLSGMFLVIEHQQTPEESWQRLGKWILTVLGVVNFEAFLA